MKTIASFERLKTIKLGEIVKISPINKVVQCRSVTKDNLPNIGMCSIYCALCDVNNRTCFKDKTGFKAIDACCATERPDKISVYFKEIKDEKDKSNN